MADQVSPLTWLYVPGDRPDRLDKAARSGADVVLIDWEDSVAPARKEHAREASLSWLREHGDGIAVEVRVNGPGTPWHEDDLAAVAACPRVGSVRLPKVETAQHVRAAAARLGEAAGITCLLESALGVENAFAVASATGQVRRLGLGEADLRADTGGSSAELLTWCRSRIVVASRAAGIGPPPMGAYPMIRDLDGLAESCRQGRALGMLGRAALHPTQVPVIRRAFLPDAAEVAAARAVIAARDAAASAALSVIQDSNGLMVDNAVVLGAERLVALSERYAERDR